jgi:uncharacterized SAM-binding protein YcdF (DUF218 family)
LEQAGLPVYSGRDPWFWALLAIVGAVLLAVAVVVTIVCFAVDFEDGKFKSKTCDVASWMILVGLVMWIGGSFMDGDTNTKICINGTCYRHRNEIFPKDPTID